MPKKSAENFEVEVGTADRSDENSVHTLRLQKYGLLVVSKSGTPLNSSFESGQMMKWAEWMVLTKVAYLLEKLGLKPEL